MLPSGGSHVLRSLSVLLALHAVFLWAVPAQERELPGAEPQVGCFRGRPLPECKSIWIVEMQAATPLAQTSRTIQYPDASEDRREEFVRVLQWNLGHMVNVGDDWGIGGVVTLGTNTEPWLSGLEARIRRWVNPHLSIEAEGGALLSNGTSGGKEPPPHCDSTSATRARSTSDGTCCEFRSSPVTRGFSIPVERNTVYPSASAWGAYPRSSAQAYSASGLWF